MWVSLIKLGIEQLWIIGFQMSDFGITKELL